MITATVHDDGSGTLAIDGTTHLVPTHDADTAREALMDIVRARARESSTILRVRAIEPGGTWTLDVTPDGSVDLAAPTPREADPSAPESDSEPQRDEAQQPGTSDAPPAPADPTPPTPPTTPPPAAQGAPVPQPQDTNAGQDAPLTRREARERSFLTTSQPVEEPPVDGWRGFLASIGIKLTPSTAETARRDDVRAVSRHWAGPRTIAVVNGKGGAGKTPATAMLSAVFARYGGGGVLAWDNNDTRGTLGWRTEPGPHEAHLRDLLPHVDRLMDPAARAADISAYVHHQATDKYDVLRSNPASLPGDQRLTEADFDAVHTVASRYFRLIVIDSGNAEDAPHWLRMIDHADQLVVATSTRSDHAEAARLLLNALHDRDERSAALADGAVVVVSQADRDEKPADTIAAHYRGLARTAVTIPYDKAMRADWLRHDGLSAATQRAWLRAAAAVAAGL